MSEIHTFDPVLFSRVENEFLFENLGKPPIVALSALPERANPRAVKPILERVYELEEQKRHSGADWVGVETLREKIRTYLDQSKKWAEMRRRNSRAPRYPSLYSYDARGRAFLGGPGSDSGRVRTYFDEKGNRIPFAVDLVPDDHAVWVAPRDTEAPVDKRLILDSEKNRLECFCGHTETFKKDSRSSYAAARARMSKHLRGAKEFVDDHREVHLMEYGG